MDISVVYVIFGSYSFFAKAMNVIFWNPTHLRSLGIKKAFRRSFSYYHLSLQLVDKQCMLCIGHVP